MAQSVADVGELSTDSDDEEYVPEGLSSEGSEEHDSDAVESKNTKLAPSGGRAGTGRKGRSRARSARKRKPTSDDSDDHQLREGEEEGEDEEVKKAKEKARIDQLWASFKQDTAVPAHKPAPNKGKAEPSPLKKMKIQKKYDFAGEEIVVEKEVCADSKEAKRYLAESASSAEPSAESLISKDADKETESRGASTPQAPSVALQARGAAHAKRGSSLGDVLKSLGKKTKMSTLDKSSMDWDQYKRKHDLEEELARNTKDGYLAKQEFLQWSDQKQFERERNERLKRFKKLH